MTTDHWAQLVQDLDNRNPDTGHHDTSGCRFPYTLSELVSTLCSGYTMSKGEPQYVRLVPEHLH